MEDRGGPLPDPARPVLIAGPTASGKSALALRLAAAQGRAVVNADALQVHADWRVLTARPSLGRRGRPPRTASTATSPGARPTPSATGCARWRRSWPRARRR